MLTGIPCLFANLSVAAWIKFDKSLLSQLLTTIVLVLALVSMGYSRKWSAHILETERTELVGACVLCCCTQLNFFLVRNALDVCQRSKALD
jgi:hypothetical protein